MSRGKLEIETLDRRYNHNLWHINKTYPIGRVYKDPSPNANAFGHGGEFFSLPGFMACTMGSLLDFLKFLNHIKIIFLEVIAFLPVPLFFEISTIRGCPLTKLTAMIHSSSSKPAVCEDWDKIKASKRTFSSNDCKLLNSCAAGIRKLFPWWKKTRHVKTKIPMMWYW